MYITISKVQFQSAKYKELHFGQKKEAHACASFVTNSITFC